MERSPSSAGLANLGCEEAGAVKTPTQTGRKLGWRKQGGEQWPKSHCVPDGAERWLRASLASFSWSLGGQ